MEINFSSSYLKNLSFSGKKFTKKQNKNFIESRYLSPVSSDADLQPAKKMPVEFFSEAFCRANIAIKNLNASRNSRKLDALLPAYNTVLSFRSEIGHIANQRDNSIEDFYTFAKEFYKYDNYLKNSNSIYRNKPLEYVDNDSFLGQNSRIYFDSGKVTLPFDKIPHNVNLPRKIAFDYETSDSNQISSARTLYDLRNHIMYGEYDKYPDNSIRATQINIFSPSRITEKFAKFASILNAPATINNAKILPNGDFVADSIVLYDLDDEQNILSSTVLLNPVVKYSNEDDEEERYFTLSATSAFVCSQADDSDLKSSYLVSPKIIAMPDDISTEAKVALVNQSGWIDNVYTDYLKVGERVYYESKKLIDVSRIK